MFGCAAACSHGLSWASTAKELIHQVGDSKTPSFSVQFSALFSSPGTHHPFYQAWHKVCWGNEQLGVAKWHMTTVSGSSLGLCASEWLHNQPLVYFCTDQPFGLPSYGVLTFQNLFSLSTFIDLYIEIYIDLSVYLYIDRSIYIYRSFSTKASLDEIILLFPTDWGDAVSQNVVFSSAR